MKAMIYNGNSDYKTSFKITDITLPKPKSNQVLVKIEASSLNIIDFERFKTSSKPSFFSKIISLFQGKKGFPLGGEFSGTVIDVGDKVNNFQVGKEVMGSTLGVMPKGSWAEYAVCDETNLVYKPNNLSYPQAAVLPLSGLAALAGVEKAKIQKGEQVLIYGASGGVGLYVLQLVKAKGCQVTAVCSTRNIELVKNYGGDSTIDYLTEDFTKSGKLFDKIISVNGYNSIKKYKKLLKPKGVYVAIGNAKQLFHAIIVSCLNPFSNQKILFSSCAISSNNSKLITIKELVEHDLLIPHIDNIYSIKDISEAIDYVINEHTQGKLAITIDFE